MLPILGNPEGGLYVPSLTVLRKIPAGYAQFFGYPNGNVGLIRRVGLLLSGGNCTSADVGVYNAVSSGGKFVPHQLLATGTLPEQTPLAEGFTPDSEGTSIHLPEWQFPILRGPEGMEELEEWPPGAEPVLTSLTGPPKHPGDVLTDQFKYICKGSLGEILGEGFYTIKVKRLTRPNDDLGNFWVPISDTPLPFENGEYETTGNNIGGEEEEGVSHFHVTITEIAGPIPEGTVLVEALIQGGRTPWYEGLGARPEKTAPADYSTVIVTPYEGRNPRVPTGAAHEYFIAVRPNGGDLVIPFTEEGGAADRHKAATPLADNPVVALGGEGGAGELAPVAFATNVVHLDCLL